jgi:hypothetical protein
LYAGKGKRFSPFQSLQTGAEINTASSLICNGFFFLPAFKWLGFEADHSPASGAQVKNVWSYTASHPVWFYDVDMGTFALPLSRLPLKSNLILCS